MKIFDELKWLYAKRVYSMFFHTWNPILAKDRKLREEFLTTFRVWNTQEPKNISEVAKDFAIRYNRSNNAKTNDSLAALIEEAIFEAKNQEMSNKDS
jgi:hypothetical protein